MINSSKDWWNEITDNHKSEIKKAVSEADKGKVIPHTEMVNKYGKWLKKP